MKISLKVKDFKKYLKSVKVYSDLSHKKSMLVTFDVREDTPKIIYQNEHIILSSTFEDLTVSERGGTPLCTMDLSVLDNVSLPGKVIEFSWGDESDPAVGVTSGPMSLNFKIRSGNPEMPVFDEDRDFRLTLPYSLLRQISMYSMMPFAFYRESNIQLSPIHFYENEGNLFVNLDDGYSVGRLITGYEAPKGLDIKIPRMYLETLYTDKSLSDEFKCTIATLEDAIFINNETTYITGSQSNTDPQPFEDVIKSQQWVVTFQASPDSLIENYKPMMNLIPTKAKGQYITATLKLPESLAFMYKHFSGDAKIDGMHVKELAIHNNATKHLIHSHPKAFIEFLNLLKGLSEIKVQASHEAVKFSVQTETLIVEYIFGLVMI